MVCRWFLPYAADHNLTRLYQLSVNYSTLNTVASLQRWLLCSQHVTTLAIKTLPNLVKLIFQLKPLKQRFSRVPLPRTKYFPIPPDNYFLCMLREIQVEWVVAGTILCGGGWLPVPFCVYGEGLQVISWNSRVRTDENHGTPGYKVYWSSHLDLRRGSCGTYKEEQKCTQDRGGKNRRKEATWNIEVQMGGG